jgi:hypothetical protein
MASFSAAVSFGPALVESERPAVVFWRCRRRQIRHGYVTPLLVDAGFKCTDLTPVIMISPFLGWVTRNDLSMRTELPRIRFFAFMVTPT